VQGHLVELMYNFVMHVPQFKCSERGLSFTSCLLVLHAPIIIMKTSIMMLYENQGGKGVQARRARLD